MSSLIKKVISANFIAAPLCAFGILLSQAALATCSNTDCSIDVFFKGVYTDETCNISINGASANETVTLPTLSTATLKKDGTEAGSKLFDITLKDCPVSRTVTLFFNSDFSSADSATGNLINSVGSDHSQNAQVRLRKEDGALIKIDDATTGQDYVISPTGDAVTHHYTASYYAKGDSAVTAGKVRAAAGVELVYK
ncbi:fimbrial protein [Enterobacillus tribolii]|uniref:Major type 1 subunit fimbrin (Pilin) n=1 Tax=Enterobacillus tribolii TaxID=1487935 RepID=A0A370R2C1_9GAMM|nr:fimbrial protein [Enterobacillus tribolii]MBW7984862.1 type 1 fimbrial protein [Enterobacillus tribolii]RDK96054.1 major type 1 subunit fimbrin (pilin) [Enterobacillus tribolii]